MTTKKTTANHKPTTGKPVGKAKAEIAPSRNHEEDRAKAKLALYPESSAAVAMFPYLKAFGIDQEAVGELSMELRDSIEKLAAGTDLKEAEKMLFGQAHALQAMFMKLASSAASQQYLLQWEAYQRIALKAQNQCRMTLDTLATIRNPPVVFAKQANIAHGPQQVNNGVQPVARGKIEPAAQSELSGATHELLEDAGTSGAVGGTLSGTSAVGKVNRAEVRRG